MLAYLLFIFFNRKVTNLLLPRSHRKRFLRLLRYDYVLAGEIVQYQEFHRRKQIWWTAESLDQLKEDVRLGFQVQSR